MSLFVPVLALEKHFPNQIRSLGWPQGHGSGAFERKNKAMKEVDRHTNKRRVNDHHVQVMVKLVHREMSMAEGPASSTPSPVEQEAVEYSASTRNGGAIGDDDVWPNIVNAISGKVKGARPGPPLPLDQIDALAEDCGEICNELDAFVVVGQVLVRYTPSSAMMLKPAHSVKLREGSYAQIIMPLVETNSASVKFVVSEFEDAPGSTSGLHPEARLPWLRRGESLTVVAATDVLHRVHVVPYFGGNSDDKGENASTFIVNTGFWRTWIPANDGDGDEEVGARADDSQASDGTIYSVCPGHGCSGRVKGPPLEPCAIVQCPNCGTAFVWG